MENLQTLGTSQLIDLLNKESTRYYKMVKDNESNKEKLDCKLVINNIQKEIDLRKKDTR